MNKESGLKRKEVLICIHQDHVTHQTCYERPERRFTAIPPKGKELESDPVSSIIIFNII
jgi:hypothetical protein